MKQYKTLIKASLALSRYREYWASVIITTVMGAVAAQGNLDVRLVIALLANFLTVAFAFMINDLEDCEDDARCPQKSQRNPISSGLLSKTKGTVVTYITALSAVGIFFYLQNTAMWVGLVSVIVSFLYSWKKVRLKSIPIVDIISHGLMLAGLQFLVGYTVFVNDFQVEMLWIFFAVTFISFYGQVFNEVRDYNVDKESGIKHTVSFVGKKIGKILMFSFMILGIVFGLIGFMSLNLNLFYVLATYFLIPSMIMISAYLYIRFVNTTCNQQLNFQESIQHYFALVLLIQVAFLA